MSIGRNHPETAKGIRDITSDYITAYLVEYERAIAGDRHEHAAAVAAELRALGHEVKVPKAVTKERAVSPEPLERAVEADAAPPKRRGRPAKNTAE